MIKIVHFDKYLRPVNKKLAIRRCTVTGWLKKKSF